MVRGGVTDILLTNEVVGAAKLDRLTQLVRAIHGSVGAGGSGGLGWGTLPRSAPFPRWPSSRPMSMSLWTTSPTLRTSMQRPQRLASLLAPTSR